MYQWEKGISLSFFQNEQGECVGGDKVVLDKVRSYGFDCVELSFSHDDYFKKYRFTEGDNAEQLFQYCESIGLKIWSIHLPFSDVWDLSCDDAQKALHHTSEDEYKSKKDVTKGQKGFVRVWSSRYKTLLCPAFL